MEPYLSYFKSGRYSFLALFFVFLMITSCEKDDDYDPFDIPVEKEEIEFADNAVALNYFDFIDSEDVEIIDVDTTQIRVSQDYLDRMNTDISKDDVLCIWRSIETASFIRKVSDVTESGSDVILTTSRAELSDLIKNGDIQLSTELFVDPNEENQALRYYNDGVYHPSVILFGDTDADGINEYATAEQLLSQNKTWHILDKDGTTNYTFTADDIKIGLKDVYTHSTLDLEIGISISLFKLKKFDCYFSGSYKLEGSMFYEWNVADKTKGGEVVLTYYPSITVLFPIGIFNIPVSVMPTLNMECDAHAKGTINITIPMEFESSFKLGPSYTRDNGWHFYKDFNHSFDFHLDKTDITYAGSLGASSGIYLKTEVNIAYCGGPYVKVGPSVSTELSASLVTGADYQFKVNTNGIFKLGGMAGAELNILGYSLSKWETEYNLFEKEVWNKEFVVDIW